MKHKCLLLVPILVLLIFASAQSAPVQKKSDLKASLDVIKTNVAKVTDAGEKERWQANIDLWQMKLAEPAAIDKMATSLNRVKANVAKVKEADEKERWQANIDLWQVVISQKGVLGKGDGEKLNALFAKMKSNVSRITETGEKQRWEANRDMWQVIIDQAMTGK